jgi:hypothetical protein
VGQVIVLAQGHTGKANRPVTKLDQAPFGQCLPGTACAGAHQLRVEQFAQWRGRLAFQDAVLPATIGHGPPDGRGRTLRVRYAPRKIAAALLLDLLVELISRQ